MGNTESVSVQKRLSRFRPEERPVVEGVFDKLQGGGAPSGAPGKTPAGSTLTLEMLQVCCSTVNTNTNSSTGMRIVPSGLALSSKYNSSPVKTYLLIYKICKSLP